MYSLKQPEVVMVSAVSAGPRAGRATRLWVPCGFPRLWAGEAGATCLYSGAGHAVAEKDDPLPIFEDFC